MRLKSMTVAVTLALLPIAVGVPRASAETASLTVAPCVPTALPSLVGSGGVMWMTSSGLTVGAVETAEVIDGWPVIAAAYWTPAASGYQLHLLPNDPLVNDEVLDVNESGWMVVYGWNPATGRNDTFVYVLPTNTWWPLATIGPDTRGRRINASGVVAGGGTTKTGNSFAAIWEFPYTKSKQLSQLGIGSYAPGINDSGVAVGGVGAHGRYTPALDPTVRRAGFHGYPWLTTAIEWSHGANPVLPSLFTQAQALAINNAGLIVGSSDQPGFVSIDAAYWLDGHVHAMGGRSGYFTEARGVSQGGWATGGSESFFAPVFQAFVWTGAGQLQILPALSPDGNSNAHAVSDVLRRVGGSSDDGTGHWAPTIWQCPAGFTTG
jgi:hypothetical protein